MSRSNYSDDYDSTELAMYRGQVASATRGRRGQKFFKDLLTALDALPVKELIADELISGDRVCAIGALGVARNIDLSKIDPEDTRKVGDIFNIAYQLAAEVVYVNDEDGRYNETPAERFIRVRNFVVSQIAKDELAAAVEVK